MNEDQLYQIEAILEHKKGRSVFIETGTALGETAAWASDHFDRVITIEYAFDLYRAAEERFFNTSNVTVLYGDSADMIKMVNHNQELDAVYWLDAHYDGGGVDLAPSGVTPIHEELRDTFRYPANHAILIDDARLFGTSPGYPDVAWVKKEAQQAIFGAYDCEVRGDVIRLVR